MFIISHASPLHFVGATFVKLNISTGPMKRSVHRSVTVRFKDGKERNISLTALHERWAAAGAQKGSRMKNAARDLEAIIAAADASLREDPEQDRAARARQAKYRIEIMCARLVEAVRQAAPSLNPGDLKGKTIDLDAIVRDAIVGQIMSS